MLIDTHAHLFWDEYEGRLDEVLEDAKEVGVEKIVVCGIDLDSSVKAIALAKKYPGRVFASVGIHPEEVLNGSERIEEQISGLMDLIQCSRDWVIAVGEMGSDANTNELANMMEIQKKLFMAQGRIALENDLPLIIHTRKTCELTINWLSELPRMPRGVFHAFSHDQASALEILNRGFLIGIGGNVSYAKRIQKIVMTLDKDSFILETDAPFLPRDLKREPSSVRMLASIVARLRNQGEEELEAYTTDNAKRLFRI